MSLPRPIDPERHPDATATWIDAPAPRALTLGRAVAILATVYALASLIAGPVFPGMPSPVAHWKAGPIYLGRPISTWGDPPHFLAVVNSVIADGDLDLHNNYDAARAGDWDVGTRFRGADIDRHVETDRGGRELSFHAPFLPLVLAAVAWPFRGTEWVESLCIWFTLACTVCGLGWWAGRQGLAPPWLLALGLATPLWAYARDVATEPYQALAWSALLVLEHPLAIATVTIAATLVKVPFVLVPLALGVVALARGERRNGLVLVASSVLAVAIAFVTIQWVFQNTEAFSLFHLGGRLRHRHATFRPRIDGILGLLFGPENGLLPFCPFLVLGWPALRKDARLFAPALAYFLLHASYSGWTAGAGFSARYLVPMLPVLVLAVARTRPRGWLAGVLVAYSAVLATIAGLLPVAAYDKTPWGIVAFLAQRIGLIVG